jgi:hypothetical protein
MRVAVHRTLPAGRREDGAKGKEELEENDEGDEENGEARGRAAA